MHQLIKNNMREMEQPLLQLTQLAAGACWRRGASWLQWILRQLCGAKFRTPAQVMFIWVWVDFKLQRQFLVVRTNSTHRFDFERVRFLKAEPFKLAGDCAREIWSTILLKKRMERCISRYHSYVSSCYCMAHQGNIIALAAKSKCAWKHETFE